MKSDPVFILGNQITLEEKYAMHHKYQIRHLGKLHNQQFQSDSYEYGLYPLILLVEFVRDAVAF